MTHRIGTNALNLNIKKLLTHFSNYFCCRCLISQSRFELKELPRVGVQNVISTRKSELVEERERVNEHGK